MTNCLFVYGTLMRAASASSLGRHERARLEASGEWLGAATIAGRLYDLGRYPVLVAPRARHERVHGEVFRLHTPALIFRWLDIYEGIPPGMTRGAEYERVTATARLAAGDTIEAGVYLFAGNVAGLRRLPDGCWRPRDGFPRRP